MVALEGAAAATNRALAPPTGGKINDLDDATSALLAVRTTFTVTVSVSVMKLLVAAQGVFSLAAQGIDFLAGQSVESLFGPVADAALAAAACHLLDERKAAAVAPAARLDTIEILPSETCALEAPDELPALLAGQAPVADELPECQAVAAGDAVEWLQNGEIPCTVGPGAYRPSWKLCGRQKHWLTVDDGGDCLNRRPGCEGCRGIWVKRRAKRIGRGGQSWRGRNSRDHRCD